MTIYQKGFLFFCLFFLAEYILGAYIIGYDQVDSNKFDFITKVRKPKLLQDETYYISDEYIGELVIWGKEIKIFLNIQDNKEDVSDIVIEKINWLNDNREGRLE